MIKSITFLSSTMGIMLGNEIFLFEVDYAR